MFRLIVLALIAALAYWSWKEHGQNLNTESYTEQLHENAALMRRCMSSKEYYADATGSSVGTTAEQEAQCARKHHLYKHEGQWHDFEKKRPQD